jgi:hypothetical protein
MLECETTEEYLRWLIEFSVPMMER